MIRQTSTAANKKNRNEQYAKVQPIPIFFVERCICSLLTTKISCDKGSSSTLQSNWRMGNTHSMSHPPVFVSEPNLTPSDKKFGWGAWEGLCYEFLWVTMSFYGFRCFY